MKSRSIGLLLVVTSLVVGCAPPPSTAPTKPTAPVATTGTTAPAAPNPPTAPAPNQISDSLKTDAYDYYGLANTTPLDFQYTSTQDGVVHSGTQTYSMQSANDKEAVYQNSRTGGLSALGDERVSVRPDGIYDMSYGQVKISGDTLELPAGLVKGKTWTSHQKLETPQGTMDLTNTYKVLGEQAFVTPAGARSGLEVKGSGKGTVNGAKVTITYDMWLVKGLGILKYVTTLKPANGKAQTLTYVESKPEGGTPSKK